MVPGCSEDERKFVPGNVLVGFKSGVTIRQAFDFATQSANDIGYVHGLSYYSNLPIDSLNYVANTLAAAGFSNKGVFIGFGVNRIVVLMSYGIEDDKSTLDEWIELTETPELKFEDMDNTKSMLLYISPGTEKKWIKTHYDGPLIEYAHLDYYLP